MSPPRGRLLTVLSVLFGILGLSNFIKFVPVTNDTGFVLLGERLSGTGNVVAGVIAGGVLLTYAAGIWQQRGWAVPLGWVYAAWVVANSILFRLRYPMPSATGQLIFEVTYSVVAITIAVGTAILLSRRRAHLV